MKILHTKDGFVITPTRIARILVRATELRKVGFRKGFALKIVASEYSLTVETARELWNARHKWMKQTR